MALLKFVLLLTPFVLYYLYRRLRWLRFEQYKDFPQLPSDLLWGHMKLMNEVRTEPGQHPRRHSDYFMYELVKRAGHPPLLLLDARPVNFAMCVVTSHAIAEQMSRPSPTFKYGALKTPNFSDFVPLIGSESLLILEGEHWKRLRRKFNPGFAPAHLMTLLPKILEKTSFFIRRLDKAARSGDVVHMDSICVDLTFDIIGSVVLDVDLNAQLLGLGAEGAEEDPILKSMRYLLEEYENANPVAELNPIRKLRRIMRGKRFDAAIKNAIKSKFSELKKHPSYGEKSRSEKGRSVVALALQDQDELKPAALQETADQIKTFMFAGHDTTSTTLQWAFYELSRSPDALAKVCNELNEVLGPNADPKAVADALLSRGEEALQRLTYLSAIIKETLRLYPPAGSAKIAPVGSNFHVHDDDGRSWLVDGIVLYSCHFIIGRDPKVYGADAEYFVPDRWLGDGGDVDTSEKTNVYNESGKEKVSHGDEKRIPPAAWRPFERGPRSCIGQELANLETRVILASTVRRYRFEKVGMGALDLGVDGKPTANEWGQYTTVEQMVNRRQITAKPLDGMQTRIYFR